MMQARPTQRQAIPGRPQIGGWVAACLWCLSAGSAWAQGPTAPPEAAAVDVLPTPTTVPNDDIPAYHFSPLQLTGIVTPDGRIAKLRAEIDVHINHSTGWFDVPLRLTQAAIRDVQHTGPREPIPYQPAGQDDGVHWLFQGAGKHHLVLDLDIELRTTAAETNLQLALPGGSRFFPSQLTLTVPVSELTVEAGRDNTVRTAPGAAGSTVITATVLGNRLDLTWRAVSLQGGAISRAQTSIALDRYRDALRLQALQDIVTDGQVGSIKVRLPEGFRLLGVAGAGYLSHTEDAQSPGWVEVQLTTGERSDVQLQWQLSSERPLEGGEWVISGFEVQGAIRQTGTIGIAPLPGYSVRRQIAEQDDVIAREEPRRVRVTGGISFLQSAWRFDRQPFALRLVLQEQRPAFDVRTQAVATAHEDRLVLDLDYAVQVHAGQVQELLLRWPAPGVEAWSYLPADAGLTVSDATDEGSPFPGELQRIELPASRDGEFNLALRYERPLTAGRFDLALPEILSERTLPAWLLLRGAGAASPKLDTASGLTPLVEPNAEAWLKQVQFVPEQDRVYRLEAVTTALTGETQVRPRELNARSLTTVTRAASDRWRVVQRIEADIKFGRIAALTLEWPASFPAAGRSAGAAAVECRTAAGERLKVLESGGDLNVVLPSEVQGALTLDLIYELPAPLPQDNAQSRLEVPLFHLREAPYLTCQVTFPDVSGVSVSAVDAQWTAIPTALEPSWMSADRRTAFSAGISYGVGDAPQRQTLEFMLARVAYDPAGRSRLRLDYRLRRASTPCVLGLPPDASGPTFAWNGRPLPAARMVPLPASQRWEIPVPEAAEGGWLRVEYQRLDPQNLDAMTPVSVALPSWPDAVQVIESFVEVGMPSDYCLLRYPAGLAPLFEWEPGLVFQRQPTAAYLARRAELIAQTSAGVNGRPEEPFFSASGVTHVYPFWGTGAALQMSIRTVRVWMLILMGAGLTLSLAFLLWSWPATRDVLTLLVLGCLLAIAGVFLPEVVELLLQPVLLGLAAAVAAIGWQARSSGALESRARQREEHSTRSEQPRSRERSAPPAVVATTQIVPHDLLESGRRP